jgi:TPP-dependent indolepyruvate ferredoxin oxidoreductase alpha subunit
MKGMDAVVEALCNACDRWYMVPGYPVTEIGERLGAELVLNEKVGLEYALGDSLSGKRAAVITKGVGLNACADPLVQATTQGLISGVVIVVGDDPDASRSENAQDSRFYGELADVPVIEPGPESVWKGIKAAFEASEQFSRIAIVRLTPALLQSEAGGSYFPRNNGKGQLADMSWTMRGRVTAAEALYYEMVMWSRRSPLNRWADGPAGAGAAPGETRVVTVYPPPGRSSRLADVREYGRPFIRNHRHMPSRLSTGVVETMHSRGFCRTLCPSCPFALLFRIIKEKGVRVICDAGCSVLALNPPYAFGIASFGLGSSVGVAARSTNVALIGDYGMLHSGLGALIDVYEKKIPLLCIVMKNNRAGMTGGQRVPDLMRYLAWASPVVCQADDEKAMRELIRVPDALLVLMIEGQCPEGESHETVEC